MSYQELLTTAKADFQAMKASQPKAPIVTPEIIQGVTVASPILVHAPKIMGYRFSKRFEVEGEDYDYNFNEISRVEDIESLLANSFLEHVQLIMREGYKMQSEDSQTLDWIKRRLFEIELLTGIPTPSWLREAARAMVKYCNAYLVLARGDASSGKAYKYMGRELEPIIGIFVPDTATFKVRRAQDGKVLHYTQYIDDTGEHKIFRPEDVIHIYYNRKGGIAYGTPWCVPVLDDIRSLRRLEEFSELLASAHTFPLYHYKVGTEKQPAHMDARTGLSEIDLMTDRVKEIPTEGSIVTDHRCEIKAVGVEGEALDLAPYLEYFNKRVKQGLCLSDISLGSGSTTNKSTAQSLDKKAENRAKDIQSVVAEAISARLFTELLLDGKFGLSYTNKVSLVFNEIDKEEERASENHEMNKFNNNATTHEELRRSMRKNPFNENDWNSSSLEKVSRTTLQKQLETLKSFGADPGTMAKLKMQTSSSGSKSTASKAKPSNQHGTKATKTRITRNKLLLERMFEEEIALLMDHVNNIKDSSLTMKYIWDKIFAPHGQKILSETYEILYPVCRDIVMDSRREMSAEIIGKSVKDICLNSLSGILSRTNISIADSTTYENCAIDIRTQIGVLNMCLRTATEYLLSQCESTFGGQGDDTNGSGCLENRTPEGEQKQD